MSAPTNLTPEWVTLANGLRVSLRHAPRLKRCAATLRVTAGSHDVPRAWPGLAHFLEHLFFLGTERFPAADGLMAYVQRHGGQINASTRERSTDFFFELAPQTFAEGLQRLGDMLARPRLALADQLREREVLHAEFLAWSRDLAAQRQFALFAGLNPEHPLRAFHAGNRYSLPVPNPAFQSALRRFYQDHYHTGQITLSLAGPQPLTELKSLAEAFASDFASGPQRPHALPPTLGNGQSTVYRTSDTQATSLLFSLESLAQGAPQALDFLCTWLNSPHPGGLLDALRQQQWADNLNASTPYQFAGQALLQIDLSGGAQRAQALDGLNALLLDWLAFFQAEYAVAALSEEYSRLQTRREQVSSALALSRRDSEHVLWELTTQGETALQAILRQLHPEAAEPSLHAWQLPPANPFLCPVTPVASPGLIRGQTSAHRGLRTFAQDRLQKRRDSSAMVFSQALGEDREEGAIYLNWRFDSAPDVQVFQALTQRLRYLREQAQQAGVELTFEATGNQWLVRTCGVHEPMPRILEQAVRLLNAPLIASESLALPSPSTRQIPLRELLKALPAVHLHCTNTRPAHALSADLALWSSAVWEGLAIGLPAPCQSALASPLKQLAGQPRTESPVPPSLGAKHLWHAITDDSAEQALLLFCPVPNAHLADEAAWRLLGQLAQAPFYQRLRGELQLGYGVFSGVRQLNGHTGLLFGVQSPQAHHGEILIHMQDFIERLPTLIEALSPAEWQARCEALAAQFDPHAMPTATAAELLWQARLAGHPTDYLANLRREILGLTPSQLHQAARQLRDADAGRLCLANTRLPGTPWQTAQ